MKDLDRLISVAPMMDWTDRHCRYFLRQFSPKVLLYTEMIVAQALIEQAGQRGEHQRAVAPLLVQLSLLYTTDAADD